MASCEAIESIRAMSDSGLLRAAVAATLIWWIAPSPASAETKLTDFVGDWHGSGTDRNSPLETTQQTRCQVTVRADLRRLTSETNCNGQAGLRKRFGLAIVLDGDQFTGTASQTSTLRGDGRAAKVRNGSVSGRKTEDTADFEVKFSGLTPNARVVLKLFTPSSYSMQISSLGITLTDVVFHRTGTR